MNDTPQPPSVTTSILSEAYARAPQFVQTYLQSGKFDEFLERLHTKTGIHIDVMNKVSNEILMMLLGITTPAEFPANLKNEAGVADSIIPVIIDETNSGVFVPLREEAKNALAPIPAPPPPTPVPPPSVAPAAAVPPPLPVANPAPAAPVVAAPQMPARTMMSDVQAVTHPAPPTVPPPAPVAAPVPPPAPTTPAPTTAETPNVATFHADLKKYGVDPYRESVE